MEAGFNQRAAAAAAGLGGATVAGVGGGDEAVFEVGRVDVLRKESNQTERGVSGGG